MGFGSEIPQRCQPHTLTPLGTCATLRADSRRPVGRNPPGTVRGRTARRPPTTKPEQAPMSTHGKLLRLDVVRCPGSGGVDSGRSRCGCRSRNRGLATLRLESHRLQRVPHGYWWHRQPCHRRGPSPGSVNTSCVASTLKRLAGNSSRPLDRSVRRSGGSVACWPAASGMPPNRFGVCCVMSSRVRCRSEPGQQIHDI